MNIYIVHAYRWGDKERHSYHVGVYTLKSLAIKAAADEEEWRGGKYKCEIIECVPDSKNKDKSPGNPYVIIKALPKINRLEQYKKKCEEKDNEQ